jgi:hypothetical protein
LQVSGLLFEPVNLWADNSYITAYIVVTPRAKLSKNVTGKCAGTSDEPGV